MKRRFVTIGAVGGRKGNDAVAADAQLLAHQRLWVSPDLDVTIRLADVVERAGGSLTRVLSADIFAIVVPEITEGSHEMVFALEHDLAIVTEAEAVEQIESQLRAEAIVKPDVAPAADEIPDVIDLDAEPGDVVETAQAEVVQASPTPSVTIDEATDLEDASRGATVVPNAAITTEPASDHLDTDLDDLLAKQASVSGLPVGDFASDDLVIDDSSADEAVIESRDLGDQPGETADSVGADAAPILAPRVGHAEADEIPAGWYPVAGSSNDERYHDGTDWTEQFRSGGDSDPLAAPLAAFADEKNRWLAAIPGPALAVIIGSVGPWAVLTTSVGNVTVAGVDMSGSIAVLLAMASAGAMAFGALRANRLARISGTAGFVVVALLGLYEMANLDSQVTDTSFANPSVGWGLWLAVLGSLGGVALGLMLARFDADNDG